MHKKPTIITSEASKSRPGSVINFVGKSICNLLYAVVCKALADLGISNVAPDLFQLAIFSTHF